MSKRSVLWNSFLIFLLAATLVTLFMTSIAMSPPIRDVAVTDIRLLYNTTVVFPTWVGPLEINVTAKNNGSKPETFNVTAYYNETQWNPIETQTVTKLAEGAEKNVTFTWDCRNLRGYPDDPELAWSYPVYEIKANASVVPGETNTTNNELVDGTVTVQWPGDCNGDGHVNQTDLDIASGAYGGPYDPRADFNGDGQVTLADIGKLMIHWHKGPLDDCDVAVTSITFSYGTTVAYPTWVYPLQIYVTVKNNGNNTETNIQVTAYYNTTAVNFTVIDTKQVNITAGDEEPLTFTWNIPNATWPYLNYTLSANATLECDENPSNNERIDGTVTVRWPGDVNGDGYVNATDLFELRDAAKYYPYYNTCADFDGDGNLTIKDTIILADYWETRPPEQ